ncbi:MAG: family 16 glycosylhydrolase [Actinomycetes bacterium]
MARKLWVVAVCGLSAAGLAVAATAVSHSASAGQGPGVAGSSAEATEAVPQAAPTSTGPSVAASPNRPSPTSPATTGPATTGPATNGVPAATAPAGTWSLVYQDDFSGPVVVGPRNSRWHSYSGMPGGNPMGRWDPNNVVVGNGQMLLKTTRQGSRWVTGGAGNQVTQTYGRWQVRMKMPYSPAVKFAVLLWPTGDWPPEIDFAERGDRNGYNAYMHWGTRADQKPGHKLQTADRLTGIDMNQWHDVGVSWRPGLIEYTVDGRVWASVAGTNVPNEPMWLAIQTEGKQSATGSDPQPPDMLVSNVKVWAWRAA